jgi:hypothetical protein
MATRPLLAILALGCALAPGCSSSNTKGVAPPMTESSPAASDDGPYIAYYGAGLIEDGSTVDASGYGTELTDGADEPSPSSALDGAATQ